MHIEELVCCFCGKEIEHSSPDPCTIELKTSRDMDEAQQLACHAECMNQAVHTEIMLLTQMA
jgi:hypothetical protein